MKVTSIQSFYGAILSNFNSTKPNFSEKKGDKVTLKRSQSDVAGTKTLWRNGVVPQWHCIAAAVAKFSRCGGNAVLLGWQSSPAAVAMQCQTSSKVLPRQRENFATEMGELCSSDRYAPILQTCNSPFCWGA